MIHEWIFATQAVGRKLSSVRRPYLVNRHTGVQNKALHNYRSRLVFTFQNSTMRTSQLSETPTGRKPKCLTGGCLHGLREIISGQVCQLQKVTATVHQAARGQADAGRAFHAWRMSSRARLAPATCQNGSPKKLCQAKSSSCLGTPMRAN